MNWFMLYEMISLLSMGYCVVLTKNSEGDSNLSDELIKELSHNSKQHVKNMRTGMLSVKPHPSSHLADGCITVPRVQTFNHNCLSNVSVNDVDASVNRLPLSHFFLQIAAFIALLVAIQDGSVLGSSIVALVGTRGCGKTATLGLVVAGAVDCGYSKIFVTTPRTGTLRTFVQFVCKGLKCLGYRKKLDYIVETDKHRSVCVTVKKVQCAYY